MKKLLRLIICVTGCELVGLLATPFTISAIPNWYANLEKPFFSPPNWIFGPVWTLLYVLMGISLFLIWDSDKKIQQKKGAIILFFMQLFFNFFWSILFFGLQSPFLAMIDILFLLVVLVYTMIGFKRISLKAYYMLFPYLFWVCFASILNLSIILLN